MDFKQHKQMEQNKLVRVIASLSSEELRFFKRFLESKIFNQHIKVVELFDHLRVQFTRVQPNFSKELIAKKIFPDVPYNDKAIRDVMSYLFKSLEQFLAFQELTKDKSQTQLALCKSYRKRGLHKLLEKTTNNLTTLVEQTNKRDLEYFDMKYQLEQEQSHALVQKGRTKENNLQEVSKVLDIRYIANRLRQCCIMFSHQSVYNISYDMGLVEAAVEEVERLDLLNIPAISIYYYAYQAQTNVDNIGYFKSMESILNSSTELFDSAEMRDIYLLAINIGIKNLNQGKLAFIPVLLNFYKSGVKKKMLLSKGLISRFTYKNMTALGLRLQQFEWVEQFIHQYKEFLETAYQEETYNYNLAKLFYSKKQYEKALQLLFLNVSVGDVYVSLDTKILLSRIYYEQHDIEAFENLIESFKIFIRRNKIISYHRISYQNFISSLTKLMKVNPYDKSEKLALLEEIKLLQPLPDKYWFVEQLSDG